jgi:alginate O-acetyltransferase complex protein AlgI
MLFNSLVFLFVFLPLTLLLVFTSPARFRNFLIFCLSLGFYAWGGVSYSLLLLGSILLNFFVGKALDTPNVKRKRWVLALGITVNLALLCVFKYANFFVENINVVAEAAGKAPVDWKHIALPIGISFFTFQAISYLVDVYRGDVAPQRNFVNLGLFISLFPQLVAGPIVRYNTIEAQLRKRSISVDKFYQGIVRFILGLAKKVLIADTLAYAADALFAAEAASLSTGDAWFGLVLYTLQIYYDFSGYSDMAIGLGYMLGFDLPENFNLPYIAHSIKNFWRRWHMSLSSWFKDYLYIPLGGSRLGAAKTYRNLLIVFLLTGLWHGANWNFVLWGIFHGLFLILERLGLERFLQRIPGVFRHIYVLAVVMFAWVLFRTPDADAAFAYYTALFGGSAQSQFVVSMIYLNPRLLCCLVIALLGAAGVFTGVEALVRQRLTTLKRYLHTPWQLMQWCFYMLVLLLSVMAMTGTTHQPFIYFQF